MRITFAPAQSRVLKLFSHSSQIRLRIVSLSASCRVLIGSSIIIKFAGLPVTPDRIPRDIIPPMLFESSNSVLLFGLLASPTPNAAPNCSILALFLRPKSWAKSSE